MPFPLPNPGPANQPFQFAQIPPQGATPEKLFLKNTTAAYVFDGTTLTQVTDADYPALTVPGVVYLDGTIYVMNSDGVIFGSDLLAPLSWSATNFITANDDGDLAVALQRHMNYILAFKDRTTEVLFDAGAPAPGSPLGKMQNAFMEVGCASAGSIATSDNTVFFMSKSSSKGRSISMMEGFTPHIVSTPFVDRLLNADDLSEVHAYVTKLNGHVFYVLTLVNSALTLVFDFITKEWHRWSSLGALTPVTPSGTSTSGTVVTFHSVGHNLLDGDPVLVLGEVYPVTRIDADHFSIVTSVVIGAMTPYTPYAETFFTGFYYTNNRSDDVVLTGAGANVYQFSTSLFQDDGRPINVVMRTTIEDFGTMKLKTFRRLELFGDIENTTVNVRWTDDDYQNFTLFRPIPVEIDRAQLRALGAARRRAFEFRHVDNTALRKLGFEVDIDIGAR